MEEKDFMDKIVHRSDAAKKGCRVIRTRWVTVNKGSDDKPQIRARSFKNSVVVGEHEYFSETPDLALVKAVIARAARWAEHEDVVVAVFDVRRAYFYAEEKKETPLLNSQTTCHRIPCNTRWKAAQGVVRNPAAASRKDELRKGLLSCCLTVGTVSRCCFRNESSSVAGTVHGDDILVAGPGQDTAKMETTHQEEMGNS